MTLPDELRRLQIALPACPKALLDLQTLLAQRDVHAQACADVIAADMALAAEVVKTVNSAMFGLLRRVDHVGEALRYLGTDQVVAITLQAALRGAFSPTPLMDGIWADAARLGWILGRAAAPLQLDPWLAHSAGLFAASGVAVFASRQDLFPAGYATLHGAHTGDPVALAAAEIALIGVGHHAVGSALCAQWGLSNLVVRYVRARATPVATWVDLDLPVRRLLVLGRCVESAEPTGTDIELPENVAELTRWTAESVTAIVRPLLEEQARRRGAST